MKLLDCCNTSYEQVYIPEIAEVFGINEAIILSQIDYWLQLYQGNSKKYHEKHYYDGRWWVFNTFENWHEQFPFFSLRNLKRIFKKLEDEEILIVGNYNKKGYDRTKWYSINYQKLAETLENAHNAKMAQWKVSDWHNGKCQNGTTNTIDYTETSTKTSNIKGTKNCSSHIDEETYYNSLRYMLSNICNELGYIDIKDDVISNVIYFWDMYYTYTMEIHPCYTYELMTKCVRELVENSTDLIGEYSKENIEKAIDEFFIQEINYCDYHFAVFVNNNMIKLKLMEGNRELHDYDVWKEVVNG